MNYEEMSDFEINKSVAKIQCGGQSGIKWLPQKKILPEFDYDSMDDACYLISPMGHEQSADYCNSWADAGPIIEANGISMIAPSDCVTDWQARPSQGNYTSGDYDKNPRRAAMICFLKMQEAKQ